MKYQIETALAYLDGAKRVLEDVLKELETQKKTVKIEIKSHFDKEVNEDDLDKDIEKFRKDLEEMLNDFTEKREG